MFYDDLLVVINGILNHTIDNDIKFQIRKLLKKVSFKKFTTLSKDDQKREILNLISEVRYGYTTLKPKKIIAVNIIENIIKSKLDI